jgi:hypothetical protein
VKEYTNSQISALIDEHIHSARDRQILKDRLIDGLTFEKLAEKHELSVQHAQRIIYKQWNKLINFLPR